MEVFQNIERHIKLKMEEFQHEQDAVMLLNDHVAEASRMAERKVRLPLLLFSVDHIPQLVTFRCQTFCMTLLHLFPEIPNS